MKEIRCPLCRKPTTWDANPFRPFCSERCQVQDLGNWASERYRVPGPPVTPDTGASSEDNEAANDVPPRERRH